MLETNKAAIKQALEAYSSKGPFKIEEIELGWINQTYKIEAQSSQYILQKLHNVFKPQVNLDFKAVSLKLKEEGLVTPELVQTDSGDDWKIIEGHCWRMQTWVQGHSFSRIQDEKMAFEAGKMSGVFHKALQNFQYTYRFKRENVHNTQFHFQLIKKLVKGGRKQANYELFEPLALKLLSREKDLANFSNLPSRNCHGDLKVSNFLFDTLNKAVSIIDLDTLGLMPWPVEMGDAFRSWCNTEEENSQVASFSEDLFEAALDGYASQMKKEWSSDEKKLLIPAVQAISLELSSRYLADVIEDRYWGWNPKLFPSRADHNLARAWGQWSLFEDVQSKFGKLKKKVQKVFY